MIHALKASLEEEGSSLFLYQYTKNGEIIAEARENRIPLVSLNTNFEEEDFFYKDGHWNESGCKKVAHQFYQIITKYNLVPDTYKPDFINN
ncbi:MAG: hypothetical protein LUD02_01530 [Tannerellaceae bacterium]|nr:hypothetical protein [Tannerellaceae bacterium]